MEASQPVAERGVRAHQREAAEPKGEKNDVDHGILHLAVWRRDAAPAVSFRLGMRGDGIRER